MTKGMGWGQPENSISRRDCRRKTDDNAWALRTEADLCRGRLARLAEAIEALGKAIANTPVLGPHRYALHLAQAALRDERLYWRGKLANALRGAGERPGWPPERPTPPTPPPPRSPDLLREWLAARRRTS